MIDVRDIPIKTRAVLEKSIKKYKLHRFRNRVFDNINIGKLNEALCIRNIDSSVFLNQKQVDERRFNILSDLLCRKELIKDFDEILRLYLDYFNIQNDVYKRINSREILSAWIISGCHNIILEDYNERQFILEFSGKLIEQFTIINNTSTDIDIDISNFNKIFIHYYDTFLIFKEKDRLSKIKYFSIEWMQLEKTRGLIKSSGKYTVEQEEEITKIINNNKKLVEKYMKSLSSDYDYNILIKIIEASNNLTKKIIHNYKLILEKELDDNQFDTFTTILNEIKKFLLIFNSNKKDEYDEKIDVEFYVQLIRANLINIDGAYVLGDYLINELLNIGSKSLWENKLSVWGEFKSTHKTDKINYNIANISIFVMEIIEEIKNEINDYKLLLETI